MITRFNYAKLRGRIREKCKNQKELSELMGISDVSLSARLNNKTQFTGEDILEICTIIDIPKCDIGEYFFCTES